MTTPVRSFHDLKRALHPYSIQKVDENCLGEMLLAAKHGDSSAMGKCLGQIENLDQPVVQDAFCFAAICGQTELVKFMIRRGVNPATPRKYDGLMDAYAERLTAMGNAIENRQKFRLLSEPLPLGQLLPFRGAI